MRRPSPRVLLTLAVVLGAGVPVLVLGQGGTSTAQVRVAAQVPLAESGSVSPVLPPAGPVPTSAAPQRPTPAEQPPEQAHPPTSLSSPSTDLVSRGRDLYQSGCASCHGQAGGGTQAGPSLVGVGAASADFQLSTGRMPLSGPVRQASHHKPAYGRANIDALVAYVASLGPGTPVPQLDEGSVTEGGRLYLSNCASCHGSTGVGGALPGGLWAPDVLRDDRVRVAEAIRVGPGVMPRFNQNTLTDQQVSDITAYMRTLPKQNAHGGWPLGSIGPVSEGAVGWVIGVGVLVAVIRALGKRAPR